jgi:glycosyltransferase involved in cell wall biosynthesis
MSGDSRLEAGLRTRLPDALEPGGPSALFVHGWALAGDTPLRALEVTVGDEATPALATRMPSPALARDRAGGEARHCIFWAIVELPATAPGDELVFGLRARLPNGDSPETRLGSVAVAPAPAPPAISPDASPAIAICMATHEPPPELLARQLGSLRAQTRTDWICLISDDASGPERFAELERLTADDPRFVVSRSRRRRGAYENFGRALAMVPDVPYVALCDQDDEWHPDKLETLLSAIGGAQLVFSDMRVVDEQGALISPTYWTDRHPNHERFASLLLGNTVTGAASLFRRELLADALPLPPRAGNLYHDHWLALVAAATGEIAYVARALHDYVQHPDAVVGHAAANRGVVGGSVSRRLLALRRRPRGDLRESWREIYFGEYMRLRLSARALRARIGKRAGRSQRHALSLVEAGSLAVPWLALRQLRRLRRDETQGSEAAMLRALAWAWIMRLRRGRGDPLDDADLPSSSGPGQRVSTEFTAR